MEKRPVRGTNQCDSGLKTLVVAQLLTKCDTIAVKLQIKLCKLLSLVTNGTKNTCTPSVLCSQPNCEDGSLLVDSLR